MPDRGFTNSAKIARRFGTRAHSILGAQRDLEPKLDSVRQAVASLLHAVPEDIAFVQNATDGVNAVLRSFPFRPDDEMVVTNHGYNACNNAARFAAEKANASVRVADIPFPIEDEDSAVAAIEKQFTDRTRLLLVDHVTSFSGIILPVARIIDSAHRRGIRVLVDGAHAPGMIPIDLAKLNADYYTANHHKWLCGPKASGFLYVRREFQMEVRPTVISHAANRSRPGRSRFLAEFDWTGTYDATTLLAVPAAIDFLTTLRPGGIEGNMHANHALAIEARRLLTEMLGIQAPAPKSWIGSLVTLPLPPCSVKNSAALDPLQRKLYERYKIEVPVFSRPQFVAMDSLFMPSLQRTRTVSSAGGSVAS